MKSQLVLLSVLVLAATLNAPAFGNADDLKWVKQCMKDNKDEGAKESVVQAYCTCMNNKMDETETRSITVWEQANPNARRACEKEAGWK